MYVETYTLLRKRYFHFDIQEEMQFIPQTLHNIIQLLANMR